LKIAGKKEKPAKATNGGGDSDDDAGDDGENKKFQNAVSKVIVVEKPNVKWEDIAGLAAAKETLKATIFLPIKFPQLFTGLFSLDFIK
jgi:vacuolar protein-sorting-associated protein 4